MNRATHLSNWLTKHAVRYVKWWSLIKLYIEIINLMLWHWNLNRFQLITLACERFGYEPNGCSKFERRQIWGSLIPCGVEGNGSVAVEKVKQTSPNWSLVRKLSVGAWLVWLVCASTENGSRKRWAARREEMKPVLTKLKHSWIPVLS